MAQNKDFKLPSTDLKNFIPQNLRNGVNTSLMDNLFNRFLTHDESVPLYGYAGRKPSSLDDRSPRVPAATVERDINSIIPVLNFKVGSETHAFTVQDLINKAHALGVSSAGLQWLYSQANNYLPPINLDKFTNFFNYYWVARSVEAVPEMPWNPDLLPEYYTIAAPVPGDLNKLNVVAATTQAIVRTGSGFEKMTFIVKFTDPTHFTITPTGSLGDYAPVQSDFELNSNDQHIEFEVFGASGVKKLVEFNILREEIYDQNGDPVGVAQFEADDQFVVDVTFLSRTYTTTFSGGSGVKGKITKVKALNDYQTVDGVLLRAGDRVLVKNANPADAGIYVVGPGIWERAEDFNGATRVAGAKVFVKGGIVNANTTFVSIEGPGGFGWQLVPGETESNTNQWQEGNFWVSGDKLSELGLGRSDAIQAVRPIIEYDGSLQLNAFIEAGSPSDKGAPYKQIKTEFNQLPMFDLYRYDGTHSGKVSAVFFYEEDMTATLDVPLQKRVLKSTNDSADFIFNHGMADDSGELLFVKKNGALKTIWHAGYVEPTIVDVTFGGTGNGALTTPSAANFAQQQIWTITADTATSFSVTGSKMKDVPVKAYVGVPYSNGEIGFTITAGSTSFEPGDTFTLRVGNLESPRYVVRAESDEVFDLHGGPTGDTTGQGAWQIPRMFYNNPYNDSRSPTGEGVLYSHFRGILANQIEGQSTDFAFGGSIKLWSEQETLLASLLMQRDLTPISVIDLAQRQYESALNSLRDVFQQNIVQYIANKGPIITLEDLNALLDWVLSVRASDNDVRTVLYDSTSPLVGFPATLPQLGIAPLVRPSVKLDEVLGRVLLQHHDGHMSPLVEDTLEFRQSILGSLTSLQIKRSNGSYTAAIGSFTNTAPVKPFMGELWVRPDGTMLSFDVDSDSYAPANPTIGSRWYQRSANVLAVWNGAEWIGQPSVAAAWVEINLANILNSMVLRAETRLFEGINPNARKFDFAELKTNPAFKAQLRKELFTFAAINGFDPLGADYVAADAFTWNYSQADAASLPSLATPTVPARWHNLLKAHQSSIAGVIATERPNLEPWKLFGFETFQAWWATLDTTKQAQYTPFIQLNDIDDTYINAGTVRVVKITNDITTFNGLQVIDGVQLTTGDRVLIQNDVSSPNNGIYTVGAGTWSRDNTPLIAKTFVTVTAGNLQKGTTWVLTATPTLNGPVIFEQARSWSSQLWDDVKTARPGLRISVDAANDTLLPPYVSSSNAWSINALTTFIPPGASLGYSFEDDSPVEAVWERTLGYNYSLARALFRYDPLAFLGFCWGFNWVEVDGILYDGFDMQMPGHKRFKLHGEPIDLINRGPIEVVGTGDPITLTYDAYDGDRRQNFTVKQNGAVIGYAQEGIEATLGGYTFTIEDAGRPFRIGDRFEVAGDLGLFVPAATHKFLGFGQTFTHALRETSIDTQSSFAVSAYREWDVQMGYRAGGLVATDDLSVYTDSETLSNSAFNLLFKRNQIARNEWVQALRVSVIQFGAYKEVEGGARSPDGTGEDWIFRIEGYNPRFIDIAYYAMSNQDQTTFNVLSGAHTNLVWKQPTVPMGVVSTTLPLTITGIQNVVNFLYGYAAYLTDRGWEFNQPSEHNIDAETGRTRNFQLEIEKFVDACYVGLEVDQGHVVNPFIDRAWFNQETGLMSEFIDTSLFDVTGHPGVFDALGVKYKKDDLDVVRTNAQSSFGATGPMFSAHIQVDDFEHLFIFNNFSQPSTASGLLYDPFSGGRVMTYKFNGRKQASTTMRPEFGGHFLVGNKVHQNLQASTDNVANFYDPNRAFENETTSRHALALLGFNTKQYFDDLDISNKTQFNFWRGLIQAKGTNMSIAAYLNNNRFDDAKIDEYWAYKVAEYGDARQREYPELKLSVNDALTQFTQLQFDAAGGEGPGELSGFSQISRFDESRWFSIDDMDQDTYFKAEVVGTFKKQAVEGEIITLPFIADNLEPTSVTGAAGSFEIINATTIMVTTLGSVQADGTNFSVIGYGPARPRFNPVKLFNYVEDELVAEISLWHPAAGIHTPAAIESINVISDQNPAKYNYSTLSLNNSSYDPLRAWGENEVGRVWFDTRNLDYLPYYDENVFLTLDERLSRWGTLADYASVDVYEWVQSSVPPSEYNVLAQEQAGDADLDPNTKAAGEVANRQTYVRNRLWSIRPVAWSYSPVPVDVDWGATPPFVGGSTDAQLSFSDGLASLDRGTFAEYGIFAGMRIGAWNNDEVNPAPLSEYLIEDEFTKVLKTIDGAAWTTQPSTTALECSVDVIASGYSSISGQLLFSAAPVETIGNATDENGLVISWGVDVPMRVTEVGSGDSEYVIVSSGVGANSSALLYGATVSVIAGEKITVELPAFGLTVIVTIAEAGEFPIDSIRNAIVSALGDKLVVRDAVVISPIVPGAVVDMSNDLQDNDFRFGWRAWSVPSQAQLAADAVQPYSSWKPYVGEFMPIVGNMTQVQDAVQYAREPLSLNDGTIIERYKTTWSNWRVLENERKSVTAVGLENGEPVLFTFDENIDPARVSVYVNGIAQLKAAYTITGKTVTVHSVRRASTATVIIRKYEPSLAELAFDPDVADNLAFQQQFKQDYEYVAQPVRDNEGSLTQMRYFFWVKNKTTTAIGKKLSVQAITQELQEGPSNYLTFQHFLESNWAQPKRYDAITISGLSYVVTKDDTFKLRFTRDFTLRDEPEELNLKNTHTEWALIRAGQKTRIPETLWQKLTDSVAGEDAAGNAVPAVRRVLYDERNGTRTQFGFNREQTLAPSNLLRSSIAHTIVNTTLVDSSGSVPVPDYISFLDLDDADAWFADATTARKTMTDIWNSAKVEQVNEIFFAALNDILASNYQLSDIFKTSRLSAYSIKVVRAAAVPQTYE
jgi:hypothetical protein